jgi:hypothetical protein
MDEPSRHSRQALPLRLVVEVVSSSSEGAALALLWWCQESRRWRKEEPSAKTLGRETGAGPGFKVWVFKIFQSEKKN